MARWHLDLDGPLEAALAAWRAAMGAGAHCARLTTGDGDRVALADDDAAATYVPPARRRRTTP